MLTKLTKNTDKTYMYIGFPGIYSSGQAMLTKTTHTDMVATIKIQLPPLGI